jgi:hypothetical protein
VSVRWRGSTFFERQAKPAHGDPHRGHAHDDTVLAPEPRPQIGKRDRWMLSDLRRNSGTMSRQHGLTAPAARARSDLAAPLAPLPRFDHVGNAHLEPSRCLTRAQLV